MGTQLKSAIAPRRVSRTLPIRRIFLVGYPGELGGAMTEAWHTVRLWRKYGLDVHLIPTRRVDPAWRARLDELGCQTHFSSVHEIESVPHLAGSPVVGMCNEDFMRQAHRFRALDCPIIWVNCMTFLYPHEHSFFADCGPADAMVFQSEYQRQQIEPHLQQYGYQADTGHLIHGAFDHSEWRFHPRPHLTGELFVVGRVARPDEDKWSSNTWPIYHRIQYQHKRALMLGMSERTHAKLGTPPAWAECLPPAAIPVTRFFESLHCMLPVNGGARENWPRAGLEAMAAGVPVVAQNQWGWREMIEHGVTGFLGDCDEELAHYTALLAYDEPLRLRIIHAAHRRLVSDLANEKKIWNGWLNLFQAIAR